MFNKKGINVEKNAGSVIIYSDRRLGVLEKVSVDKYAVQFVMQFAMNFKGNDIFFGIGMVLVYEEEKHDIF